MKRVISIVLSLVLVMGSFLFSGCANQTEDTIISEETESVTEIENEEITTDNVDETIEETTEASEVTTYTNMEDYVGSYTDGYDWFSIYSAYGSTYYMDIYLTRLTSIDRCSIELFDGRLSVTGIDAAGNEISFEFFNEGEYFSLCVTDSTWGYLENGICFSEISRIVPNQSDNSKQSLINKISELEIDLSQYGEYEFMYSYVDGILYMLVFMGDTVSIDSYYVNDNEEVVYCHAFGAGELYYDDYETMQQALESYGYEYPIYNSTEIQAVILG